VAWSRYTWRRGSVPLWWSVNIKNNGIGEAEIRIRPEATFKGSRRWAGPWGRGLGWGCRPAGLLGCRPAGLQGCWAAGPLG
jgi:hypothetical protein